MKTIANKGDGIIELQNMVDKHRSVLQEKGILKDKRTQRTKEKIKELIKLKLEQQFWTRERNKLLEQQLPHVLNQELSPYKLSEQLFNK